MTQRSKAVIQSEAKAAWEAAGYHGMVANCTGSGKSKIAVDAAEDAYQEVKDSGVLIGKSLRILLVTYTITAGEIDWPKEFRKWKMGKLLKYMDIVCYASLHKVDKRKYNLVILDEAHHLTELNYKFFVGNPQPRVLMLTATPPDPDKEAGKVGLLARLGPIVYTYHLDEAVVDGNVADYKLWIVDYRLDDKDKYIKQNIKKVPVMMTEKQYYGYLNAILKIAYKKRAIGWAESIVNKRMHFLNSLRSNTTLAQKLLARIHPDKRVLIFASSIAQTSQLCPHTYHSETTSEDLDLFRKGKILRLACVKALNESVNLENLDDSVMTAPNSRMRDFLQRMGRNLRFRPGYTANIFAFRCLGTVAEKWVDEAISSLDQSKIRYYSASNLK